jgi:hypothetical protein
MPVVVVVLLLRTSYDEPVKTPDPSIEELLLLTTTVPTVSANVCVSRFPPLRVTGAASGITSDAPTFKVPKVTVAPPFQLFAVLVRTTIAPAK